MTETKHYETPENARIFDWHSWDWDRANPKPPTNRNPDGTPLGKPIYRSRDRKTFCDRDYLKRIKCMPGMASFHGTPLTYFIEQGDM